MGKPTPNFVAISSLACGPNNGRIPLIKQLSNDEVSILTGISETFYEEPLVGAMMLEGVTVKGYIIEKDKFQFAGKIEFEGARMKPYMNLTPINTKFAVKGGRSGDAVLAVSKKILYHEMGTPVVVATQINDGWTAQLNNREEVCLFSTELELLEFILRERRTDQSLLAKKKFTAEQEKGFRLQVHRKFQLSLNLESALIIS